MVSFLNYPTLVQFASNSRQLWNKMADWLTGAFSVSVTKNFRVKVSGLVRLRPTVNLAFRDMYQIHWRLLKCLGMRDIYTHQGVKRCWMWRLTEVTSGLCLTALFWRTAELYYNHVLKYFPTEILLSALNDPTAGILFTPLAFKYWGLPKHSKICLYIVRLVQTCNETPLNRTL